MDSVERLKRSLEKVLAQLSQRREEFSLSLPKNFRLRLPSFSLRGLLSLRRKRTKDEGQRTAYRPLEVECLTQGMRVRWFLRKISLATVAVLFFVSLAMAGYLMVLQNSFWSVAAEARGVREERTRLVLELNNISRQIQASGIGDIMRFKTPESFLPTPWRITPLIARVLDVASSTGVGVQQLRYERRRVNLGTITLDVWWKWSPRTPTDSFVDFLVKVKDASPEIIRVLVVSEQRTSTSGKGRVVLVIAPVERGGDNLGLATSPTPES